MATMQVVAWGTVGAVDGTQDMEEVASTSLSMEQVELIRHRATEVSILSFQSLIACDRSLNESKSKAKFIATSFSNSILSFGKI